MTREGVAQKERCGANKKSGGTCGRVAGAGTDHLGYGSCNLHTGATVSGRKHAATLRADAWARILELTDPALNALAQLLDDAEVESVRLGAARDILDRAGLGAKHVHELTGPAGGPIPVEVRTADLLARAALLAPAKRKPAKRKPAAKKRSAKRVTRKPEPE